MPQRPLRHFVPVLVLSAVAVPAFGLAQPLAAPVVPSAPALAVAVSTAPPPDVERVVVGDMVVDWIGGAPDGAVESLASPSAETTGPAPHQGEGRASEATEMYAAVGTDESEEVTEYNEAVRGGYALFSTTARWLPDGYTIRLAGGDGRIEHFRDELVQMANAATTVTGVPVRVARGVGGPEDPGRGEIVVVLDHGPCGSRATGCGGPAMTPSELVSGRVWLSPSGLDRSPAQRANLVTHELGHALGLQHFDGSWTDGRQVMHPSISGITTFRAGDRAGLRWLAGADDRPAGTVTSRAYAAGRVHVAGTVSSGSRVRISSGSVAVEVGASGGRFSGSIPLPAGNHLVCGSSVDAAPGFRRGVGCGYVEAPGTPFGRGDGVRSSFETIRLRGWAMDPQTAEPVRVQVRRNGVLVAQARADRHRDDLGDLAPHYGTGHGFQVEIPAEAGLNRVCVRVIGVGGGGDWRAGCAVVVHSVDPVGVLESVRAEGLGVTLSGWALDPNTPDAVSISVLVDGSVPSVGGSARASEERPDVVRGYRDHGPDKGFTHFVALSRGRHEVCVTAVNVGLGRDRLLGCQHVVVEEPSAAPVRAMSAAKHQVVDVVRDAAASPQQVVAGVSAPRLGK